MLAVTVKRALKELILLLVVTLKGPALSWRRKRACGSDVQRTASTSGAQDVAGQLASGRGLVQGVSAQEDSEAACPSPTLCPGETTSRAQSGQTHAVSRTAMTLAEG